MGVGAFTIEELDTCFGARVRDFDLRSLDQHSATELRELWIEYGLLIFDDQHLDRHEQDDVARWFGPLEFSAAPISNVDRDGTIRSDPDDDIVKSLRGNEGWHHDSTYMPVQALGAVFSAEILPPSGSTTGFADMRAAFDALDPAFQQRLAGLTASHSLEYSQGRNGYLPTPRPDGGYAQYGYHGGPTPRRPLIKVHPDTGRSNLCVGRHAHDVDDMTADESVAFLDQIDEQACQGDRVHYHQWAPGETVVWDNRRLMHRAVPFDMTEGRRMWHTRIAGDPETEQALNYPAGDSPAR